MSDKLKPCPFCGCPDIYLTFRQDWNGEEIPIIFCNKCKISVEAEDDLPSMPYVNWYKRMKDKVTKVWNMRGEQDE